MKKVLPVMTHLFIMAPIKRTRNRATRLKLLLNDVAENITPIETREKQDNTITQKPNRRVTRQGVNKEEIPNNENASASRHLEIQKRLGVCQRRLLRYR